MNSLNRKLIWLTLFSIAMGFMETAIVIYLRKIYYPSGFQFPLIPIDPGIALIEFLREAATIIMLVGIGILTGKTSSQKFAFFVYSFAIWDLFYYLFLKLFLGWPESLFTWDILFLIPVPWVGPVLAPCIVSLTMIVLTVSVIYSEAKGYETRVKIREWLLWSFGSTVVIFSFVLDYFKYMNQNNSAKHIWTLSSKEALFNEITNYIPANYNWWIFSLGEVLIILGIVLFIKRIKTIGFCSNKKAVQK
jgi:hypothetical protein